MSVIGVSQQGAAEERALDQSQWRRLQLQLTYLNEHIPYYQKLFKEHDFEPNKIDPREPLKGLPSLYKSTVRANAILFRNQRILSTHGSLSSGSTGEPFKSEFDPKTWYRRKYISKYWERAKLGMLPLKKTALLECIETRELKSRNRKTALLWPILRMRTFSVYEDPTTLVSELSRYQPATLCGYPGHLVSLAQHIESSGAQACSPNQIFTSSELLSTASRNFIESVFNAPVYDHYGCTEFKEVAWQCRHRDAYHINTDEVYVEILDTAADHALDEQAGEIIITDLRNKAMPLLRYHTGDKGYWVDSCKCGGKGPHLKLVVGRSSDQLIQSNGEPTSPYRITTFIEQFTQISQFQLVQRVPGRVELNTVWRSLTSAFDQAEVAQKLSTLNDTNMSIELNIHKRIEPEKNGKTPVLIQHLKAT
jgi:phenylacetate-CoA ligase